MTDEHRSLGSGDRLASDPSQRMAQVGFGGELEAANLLHPALGYADIAHVVALADAGIVGADTASALVAALRRLGARPWEEIDWDPVVGDVDNNREALLHDDIGDLAGWLATGRARREATTIAWLLVVREAHLSAANSALDALNAIIDLATRHAGTLVTDFTYLQHAQPTTFGHYLLSFAYPMLRDVERLLGALDEIDLSPAGSGSVNGSRFPLNRRLLAELLGFPRLRTHTRDAMWPADVAQRPGQAVAVAAVTLDRLVAELLLFTTSEFGFVELADRHTRTSVIMPQKKNPYSLTQIRGLLRELIGMAHTITLTQLTPTGQPDNRTTAYEQVPRLLERLAAAHALAAEVLSDLRVDEDAMLRSANDDFTASTDLCDLITSRLGLTNRTAHRVVGRAVRNASEAGRDGLSRDDLVKAAATLDVDVSGLDAGEVEACNDPAVLVGLRTTTGGAADAPMREMLDDLNAEVAKLRRRITERAGALDGFDNVADAYLQRISA